MPIVGDITISNPHEMQDNEEEETLSQSPASEVPPLVATSCCHNNREARQSERTSRHPIPFLSSYLL